MSDFPSVPPVVQVVGMGLSGVESLAPAVLKLVQSATLIIGAQRLLDTLDETNQTATVWPLGNLAAVIDSLRSHLSTHPDTRAVILTTGDPLFFGLGRLLLAQLPPEQLAFHPQVSSIQLAFSRLKLPWQDATLVSVHGRGEQLLIKALKRGARKIAVLTDGVLTPTVISNLIQSLELPVHYQLWVCENLGGEQERVRLHRDEGDAEGADYAALNVLVLLRLDTQTEVIDRLSLPLIGLPDSVFHSFPDRPLLITKREIRLLVLGAIAPLPHQTIWDIGAGTGSVSVELSRLCPTAQIYAIEKTAIGVSLIRQNVDAFAIAPVHPIHAKAPALLADLPTPDRVFIGGSSGQLTPVLDYLNERMLADCESDRGDASLRIVLAIATVEHLHDVMQWAAQPVIANHWRSQLTQINISRSLPVGPLTRFSPLNPVTLVTLQAFN